MAPVNVAIAKEQNKFVIDNTEIQLKNPVLDNFRGLGPFLYDINVRYPDNIAQIEASTGTSETYGNLNKRCIQLALELRQRWNVQPGDIFTVCSFNTMDVSVPIIAGLYLGAKLSFLDPTISVQTTTHLLSQVKPKLIFSTSDSVEMIEKSLESNGYSAKIIVLDDGSFPEHVKFSELFEKVIDPTNFEPYCPRDPRETAIILFSSGTTGLAKGICISHIGLLFASMHWPNTLKGTIKVLLNFTSFYWISGVSNFMISYLVQGTRIIVPFFDASTALETLDKYKVNFTITSTIINQYLKNQDYAKYDLRHLKYVGVGGTPSTAQQMREVRRIFPHSVILHAYGMTELSGIVMCFHDIEKYKDVMENKPASVGSVVPGLSCKVVDLETEQTLGPNQQGELRIKSPSVMNGYHNRDSSDAWDSEGWLCSGDICYYDEDGCFFIVDRIKDMLKFRSWHVTPSAIEGVLMQHPLVQEAVVVGIPHEVDGDLPMGIVVLNGDQRPPDGIEQELIQFVEDRVGFRDRLHGGLKVVQSIPRTPTGKSKRRDLRNMVLEGKL